MTIHYMDGGPFEAAHRYWADPVRVIAYNSKNGEFIYVTNGDGHVLSELAHHFDPPPPIPAAARKPKVGEVWMLNGEAMLLVGVRNEKTAKPAIFWLVDDSGFPCGPRSVPVGDDRPATPEEAELFRELLKNLKRSLAEA